MKYNLFVLVTSLMAFSGCISGAKVEDREDLGFGFHHDRIAEPTVNHSESIGHFDYLFYRNRKLSQSDKFAVAPSGEAIVYQDAASGNILMFRPKQQSIVQLTSTFPGLVDRFIWHEADGYIMALVADSRDHKRWIKLVVKSQ